MNSLSRAVLSFFELLEAEGREFKTKAEASVRSLIVFFFAGLLLVVAAVFAGFAFYTALLPLTGRPLAALASALLFAVSGIFLMRRSHELDESKDTGQEYHE